MTVYPPALSADQSHRITPGDADPAGSRAQAPDLLDDHHRLGASAWRAVTGIMYFPPRRAGDYEGGQDLEVFGRAFDLTGGTLRLDLHDVVANDEHAVALYTANGERAGRLHDHTVGVFHARDGKITQVWLHSDDFYAADEFWS